MDNIISESQSLAYSELLEILSYMKEENVNKIPTKLIDVFKKHSSSNYVNHLNKHIPLENQQITEETSAVLALLMINYWCESEEEKKSLLEKYQKNEDTYQANLRKKYNPDNIFTQISQDTTVLNNTNSTENNIVDQKVLLIDVNSLSWYKKIFYRIRNFIFKFINNNKSV